MISGPGAALGATFINRRTGSEYTAMPVASSITYNTDMRRLSDSFDFEIQFGRNSTIDIISHDFVEFWFTIDNQKFQIGVGFVEKLKKHASASALTLQANGRDLLGQLINIPFTKRLYRPNYKLADFLKVALENSYVDSYLVYRNRSNAVIDRGAYKGSLLFADTLEANRAQVIEQYADIAQNVVYLDRLGRVTIYGRANKEDLLIGQTLSHHGDLNVSDLVMTQDLSRVYSEATVIVAGEKVLDTNRVVSPKYINDDARVSHLYQPTFKTFSVSELVDQAGEQNYQSQQQRVAKSIIRKSNQALNEVIVQTNRPYYVSTSGEKIPYEVGQNWRIKSTPFQIDQDMKLVGIGYQQQPESLSVQLAFVEPDTLV